MSGRAPWTVDQLTVRREGGAIIITPLGSVESGGPGDGRLGGPGRLAGAARARLSEGRTGASARPIRRRPPAGSRPGCRAPGRSTRPAVTRAACPSASSPATLTPSAASRRPCSAIPPGGNEVCVFLAPGEDSRAVAGFSVDVCRALTVEGDEPTLGPLAVRDVPSGRAPAGGTAGEGGARTLQRARGRRARRWTGPASPTANSSAPPRCCAALRAGPCRSSTTRPKEISFKIVYYGPGRGGQDGEPAARAPLAARRQPGEHDLARHRRRPDALLRLPARVRPDACADFVTKFQLYTVPGPGLLQHDAQAGAARRRRRRVRRRLAVGAPARRTSRASGTSRRISASTTTISTSMPVRDPVQQARPAQRRPGGVPRVSC